MLESIPRSYVWTLSSNHRTTSLPWAQGWTGTLYTSTRRTRSIETLSGYSGWHVLSSQFCQHSRWIVGDWNALAFLYTLSRQKMVIKQLSKALGLWHPMLHQDARVYPCAKYHDNIPWLYGIYPLTNTNHSSEMISLCHPQCSRDS